MANPTIPVMFRILKNDGHSEVFALFPTLPGTNEPHTCTCYQHIGQHSSADVYGCIDDSRPATPNEYADLLRELNWVYNDCSLKVVKRSTYRMHKERRAELNRSQCAQ